jgi:hypothetical protein
VGFGGYGAYRNRVQAIISNNHMDDVSHTPAFLQGGNAERQEEATGNAVFAQLRDNTWPTMAAQPPLLLNDGLPGNTVLLVDPTPPHARVADVIPYQA